MRIFRILIIFPVALALNNVCRSPEDYCYKETSKNCWFNADVSSSPGKVAENHGFPFQEHQIITEDGYNLNLFRIGGFSGQPVLLHHGIISSAMSFMAAGNPFQLAEKGYDVWLANHRGNTYSSRHASLNMSQPSFWDFSFHEIALLDIPPTVNYIRNLTGNRIIYVGHSMGTTISFIYSSLKRDHAEKNLKGIIALCPVASLKFIPTPFQPVLPFLNKIVEDLLRKKIYVLFPHPKKLSDVLLNYCGRYPGIRTCMDLFLLISGSSSEGITPEDLSLILSVHPARTSLKCLSHYLQIISSGRFQQYNYTPEVNLKKYKSVEPPVYDLGKITVPVHLFYGRADSLVSKEEVAWIFSELKTPKSMNLVPKSRKIKYNHMDFLQAKDIEKFLYNPLFRKIKSL